MCDGAATMDLVCDSNMLLEKHVRSHLSLLTEAHLASFLPVFNSSTVLWHEHGWHRQLTHLPPARHAPTGRQDSTNH